MTTDPDDIPIYTRRDIKRIGHALLQIPHTGDIEFEGGKPPSEPTPDLLVDMLEQLRDILQSQMAPVTEVEARVWTAWNALPDSEESPVKRVAQQLGMQAVDVAFIVLPAERFGPWDDDQEPDL
ncbi:hypothetical protein ACIGO9_28950 [Nocardia asteroides]|uniref:hypothetical protein n=1 Tax=Nocardia asteroides TaxID=1824 RepID=UPI0037CCBC2A